jgi:hypothetical protein
MIIAAVVCGAAPVYAQDEEVQYKKFKLDKETCDAAILYKKADDGMLVGVSAITLGKGAEFRKWEVTDIRLRVAGRAIRPDKSEPFFTTKESFFRIPAAVLFAAIGAMGDYGGSGLSQGISAAGMAIGLGLLVMQAKGEITGERATFRLDRATVDQIDQGRDTIEITMENEQMHWKDTVRTGLAPRPSRSGGNYGYDKMSSEELQWIMDKLEDRAGALEKEQSNYSYGSDPQYDDIQHQIEDMQTRRAVAYSIWFDRNRQETSS